MNKILVTGTAGFIGFHLVNGLASTGVDIVGIDNINNYYDPELKLARLSEAGICSTEIEWYNPVQSKKHPNYRFIRMNLEDEKKLHELFESEKFDCVVNLAAQAGVRYSIDNPSAYIQTNLVGFGNVLEGCRKTKVKHLVYASSSSVYGMNDKIPFSTMDNVDHPISLYAATKKANELMAHTYSHLYNLPTTGLRFFTVYGPWGRPDMAYFLFSKAICNNEPINVFNEGKMERDFTYIDDVISGIMAVINNLPLPSKKSPLNPGISKGPYRVYNIGNDTPVNLLTFIEIVEKNFARKAKKIFLPIQDGDVERTWADIQSVVEEVHYQPKYKLEVGIRRFTDWYKVYYNIKLQ